MITPIDGIVRPEWSTNPDEYAILQEAINSAEYHKAKVVLSSKVYHTNNTLNIYTGTIIEGTIFGAYDRSRVTGSMISYHGEGIAIKINCVDDSATSSANKETCYRFRLANFSIVKGFEPENPSTYINSCPNSAIGLSFETETTETAPRSGQIENLTIRNFGTGIRINGISYVNFYNINITDFVTGILIEKNNIDHYIEFARFDKIMLGTKFSPACNTTGILIRDGNFVYFNQIDINDCRTGFLAESKYKLFSIYLDKIHILRASTCIYIYARESHITRFSVTDVTLDYPSGTGTPYVGNAKYGLKFNRNGEYTISDSSFDRITDSDAYNVPNRIHYFVYISGGDNLVYCRFSNLRALNKVYGISELKRFQILNAIPWGQVYASRNSPTDIEILSRNIFGSNYPMVITTVEGTTSVSSGSQFIEGSSGKLILRLSISGSSSSSFLVKFFIPLLA